MMKRITIIAALTFFLLFSGSFASTALAQAAVPGDDIMLRQADEIKKHYTDQGFSVLQDVLIPMESMAPYDVVAPLLQGQMYELVFIGNPNAVRLKLELYDAGDNKMDEKFVFQNRQEPNYILYTIVPERSGNYHFAFLQQWKNKSLNASLCLMRLSRDGMSRIIPYTQGSKS